MIDLDNNKLVEFLSVGLLTIYRLKKVAPTTKVYLIWHPT